ncbi:hypothetical protein [Cryobacterium ruanii]|uniref:Uncharacterized protein n=1 Tax=Cryobacterium ruanii TaxID=1259197 RepID=A0A4R9AMV3_9MICO|nr:hypothetical protein [Cryobacterium ruanii]TFD66324.1 hypothetical protein E3T47_07385 [Cryobacterium ruanii]
MAAIAGPDVRTTPDHFASRVPASGWLLLTAGFFLASAVLQIVASLERWVSFAGARTDGNIEDHLFDYYYPADRGKISVPPRKSSASVSFSLHSEFWRWLVASGLTATVPPACSLALLPRPSPLPELMHSSPV